MQLFELPAKPIAATYMVESSEAAVPIPPRLAGFCDYLRMERARWRSLDGAALDRNLSAAQTYVDLWSAQVLSADDLADAVARFHGLPRIDPERLAPHPDLVPELSLSFLKEGWILPLSAEGQVLLVVADPTRAETIRDVGVAVGTSWTVGVAAFDELAIVFEQMLASPDAATRAGEDDDGAADDEPETLEELLSGAPVVKAVNEILEAAVSTNATDIHIEPRADGARIRLRVDGMLRQHATFPLGKARGIVSRLKLLAGLNIAERRLPQDGRARLKVGSAEVDVRAATMPVLHGENLVLRLLAKSSTALDLGRLGIARADLERLQSQLRQPHGLIVVTGPTGSGKTTTLAAALAALNAPDRKIVTVEDPIEYQIEGVSQTQVKPAIDLTFASALRSFLRQDPDIIMVGEMRDKDTAAIGIRAALTGHLVLSTLHTNSACDAIVRLADLGVEPYLLEGTLRCVVGQRLVRRLCERCRRPVSGTAGPAAMLARCGIAQQADDRFCEAVGCQACAGTGYRGRIGLFEVLLFDEAVRSLLRTKPGPAEVLALALERGMTTMLQDGIEKARAGLTSLDEVTRATV